MTTLTALIPTAANNLARLTVLRRAMESALCQLGDGDEVLVAGDTTDAPLDEVRELCQRLNAEAPAGVFVRFVPHSPGYHDWGHSQLTYAQQRARGEYISYCDDDDVWVPGAFDAMREAIDAQKERGPLLFKFRTHYGFTVWDTEGLVAQARIGGHCLVTPALPSFLGEWTGRYEGDFDAIVSTLALWAAVGVEPVWVDRLICTARPAVRYL